MQRLMKVSLLSVFTLSLLSCASGPGVLEPLADSAETDLDVNMAKNATYTELKARLKTLGYEDVGLQYESDAVLKVLLEVFSDPRAANKEIALLYTGAALSYDPTHKSLTVGGALKDPMIKFIETKIPSRK